MQSEKFIKDSAGETPTAAVETTASRKGPGSGCGSGIAVFRQCGKIAWDDGFRIKVRECRRADVALGGGALAVYSSGGLRGLEMGAGPRFMEAFDYASLDGIGTEEFRLQHCQETSTGTEAPASAPAFH